MRHGDESVNNAQVQVLTVARALSLSRTPKAGRKGEKKRGNKGVVRDPHISWKARLVICPIRISSHRNPSRTVSSIRSYL